MSARNPVCAALALSATLLVPAAAHAQVFRAYVASDGFDTNPCTLSQPCRLLPAAIAAVAAGGEIWMLDSANYNTAPVNVTKSVSILAVPGVVGSVVSTAAGPAFSINTAGVEVVLRNLVIVPLPGATGDGVRMFNGASLRVEQCVVANNASHGIFVAASADVVIADSTIRDNGAAGIFLEKSSRTTIVRTVISGHATSAGIFAGDVTPQTLGLDVAGSTLSGNQWGGFAVSSNAANILGASISDSHILRSTQYGVLASSNAGGPVTVSLRGNVISNTTGSGVRSQGAGTKVYATGNLVSANTIGLEEANSGTIESAGDNAVNNNPTPFVGVISVVPKI